MIVDIIIQQQQQTQSFNKLLESMGRLFEPRSEKTGPRGFRPGPTQTKLYSHV